MSPITPGDWVDYPHPNSKVNAAKMFAFESRIDAGLAPIETNVAVIKEAPLNLAYPEIGLVNGGDFAVAMDAANVLLPDSGGEIFVPPGSYTHLTSIDYNSLRSVTVKGDGGKSAGASTSTVITYAGAGAYALRAQSSVGFRMENLQYLYSNPSFAGTLIELSRDSAGADTADFEIKDCYLGGAAIQSALYLVRLGEAIIGNFHRVTLAGAQFGVRGLHLGVPQVYSNSINFVDCTFKDQTVQHILDPGEGWTFVNPTVEPLIGGFAGFITHTGSVAEQLTILGGWFGDVTGSPGQDWITFKGRGLTCLGTMFGGGTFAVRLDETNTDGVTIKNCQFEGQTTAGVRVGGAAGQTNFDISGNHLVGTPAVAAFAGTMPSNSRIQLADGVSGVYSDEIPIIAAVVSDASFPATPPDGMQAMENSGGVVKHCVRIGGVWKKVTLA